MSLSSALNSAKSSLAASQAQTALVSRNIANVNTAGATRKYVETVTGADGRVEIRNVAQSGNSVLYRNMLDSTSSVQTSSAVLEGLKRLNEVIGDTEASGSPAARIGKLDAALRSYAVSPNNTQFARAAVDAARDVSDTLNALSTTADTVRRDADSQLVAASDDMNAILADIAKLNDTIVSGTRGKVDVTDAVDNRDRLVARLATYVGINAQVRGDNDLVLHTDSGVTLFDKTARPVEYTATSPLQPGRNGNGFRIDGTVVTGDNAAMPVRDGLVAGLTRLRDETMPAFQSQLDAMARALITTFAESKTGGADPKAGLFTAATAATADAVAALAPNAATPAGLAGQIRIQASAAEKPEFLRDGGFNGADYDLNTANAAGYTARLDALIGTMAQSRSFDATGAASTGTLAAFAASSVSWLQASRVEAAGETTYRQTLLDKTQETLSDATGINLETELTLLLDLQRSFQASSKIISTVDEMMAALLQSV